MPQQVFCSFSYTVASKQSAQPQAGQQQHVFERNSFRQLTRTRTTKATTTLNRNSGSWFMRCAHSTRSLPCGRDSGSILSLAMSRSIVLCLSLSRSHTRILLSAACTPFSWWRPTRWVNLLYVYIDMYVRMCEGVARVSNKLLGLGLRAWFVCCSVCERLYVFASACVPVWVGWQFYCTARSRAMSAFAVLIFAWNTFWANFVLVVLFIPSVVLASHFVCESKRST